jgi:hypothetical protein
MPGYSGEDDGSGDSGVMPTVGPSKDAVKKLDQIIQVGENIHVYSSVQVTYHFLSTEFPHKICDCYIVLENVRTRNHNQRRNQKGQ